MQFDEGRRGLGKTGHIHVYEAPIPTYDAGAPPETIYPWWRHSQILDLAAEVGPVIEEYRAQGLGFRRIAALLNLSGCSPLRGGTWHPTTVVRVWQTYTTRPVQLKLSKPSRREGYG